MQCEMLLTHPIAQAVFETSNHAFFTLLLNLHYASLCNTKFSLAKLFRMRVYANENHMETAILKL